MISDDKNKSFSKTLTSAAENIHFPVKDWKTISQTTFQPTKLSQSKARTF